MDFNCVDKAYASNNSHWGVTSSVTVSDPHSTREAAIGPLSPLAPPTVDWGSHLAVWNTVSLMAHSHSTHGQAAFCSRGEGRQEVNAGRIIIGTTPHISTLILEPRIGMEHKQEAIIEVVFPPVSRGSEKRCPRGAAGTAQWACTPSPGAGSCRRKSRHFWRENWTDSCSGTSWSKKIALSMICSEIIQYANNIEALCPPSPPSL